MRLQRDQREEGDQHQEESHQRKAGDQRPP